MWNNMNNVCTGFVVDDLDTNKMMINILGLNKEKHGDKKQMSVYANQWRFRSSRGITHSLFYYFDKGSLNANEMIRQFLDVLIAYESMGVK